MRSHETVDLPFPVLYVWALNGQNSYKSQGGALYYGGWACKAEDLQSVTDQGGLWTPEGWKQVTIASRDGGEFEAFTARSVIIAPIGKRESWLMDGKRSTDYIEGGRRHLQVLAYLADAQGEPSARTFVPWGPVVLTAKGYQARNLLDAFSRWDKSTAQIRWKVAPGVPAWCFYMALGTFGRERQAINVGKPGAQSPITPITAYIHERFDEKLIGSLFVGPEIAEKMAELQDQAQEWLNAWKKVPLAEAVEEYQETPFPAEIEEEIPF
jgi:hypothetical protein